MRVKLLSRGRGDLQVAIKLGIQLLQLAWRTLVLLEECKGGAEKGEKECNTN